MPDGFNDPTVDDVHDVDVPDDFDDLDDPSDIQAGGSVRTGDAAVDGVLDEVDGLTGQAIDEHVAVFERAHEQLRRSLDAQPDR